MQAASLAARTTKASQKENSWSRVEIDGGEYVVEISNDKVEFGQQFNLPASDFGV